MEITFELNLKITGSSLQEVDEGLMKAAGERLRARLDKPINFGVSVNPDKKSPTVPAPVEVPKEAVAAINKVETAEVNEPAKKPKGRPKSAAKVLADRRDEDAAPSVFEPAPEETKPVDQNEPLTDEETKALRAEGLDYLGKISAAYNMDHARDCIIKYGAMKVSALKDDKLKPFIAHCQSELNKVSVSRT